MENTPTKRKELSLNTPKRKSFFILGLGILLILLSIVSLFVGSSSMTFLDTIHALFKSSEASQAHIRIIWNIRIPRILAALIAGAGLSISGLIMQTSLNNPMASPSTLGVANGAVFGANLAIIVFAGGYLNTGNNVQSYATNANPYSTSFLAFIFAILSILLILALSKLGRFSSTSIVLMGVAMTSVWSAATTILQYYATDVGLSAAVIWSFGDLGRATYQTDWIMLTVVAISSIAFILLRYRYNALLSGEASAKALGINVNLFRLISLLLASLITAVCVSYLGVIGFVGIICPHSMKRLLGEDHKYVLPSSLISGALLLIVSDTLSRTIGGGSSLPVGAITTLFGAPFFLYLIFSKKGVNHD